MGVTPLNAAIPVVGGSTEPIVRVRIKTDQAVLQHPFRELRYSINPGKAKVTGDSKVVVRTPALAKLFCKSETVYVSIVGQNSQPIAAKSVELVQGAGSIERKFNVTSEKGKCNEILFIPMEEYLVGVISKEMVPSWPKESLRAQAIASRTYAIYQMKKRSKSSFDLESTILDQVFEFPERVSASVKDAVAQTRGEVLGITKNQKFEPIKSFFHSTCGGKTELPEQVWGEKFAGFKRTAKCPYCYESPRMTWKETLTVADIEKRLGAKDRTLTELKILPRYASTRHAGVAVSWKSSLKEWIELIPLDVFRHKVGTERVRSNWFQLVKTSHAGEAAYEFAGQGFGHGVGLCQWGARGMAVQGKNYKQILSLYYPDAHLGKLW